jgi:hypothetical protein
LIQERDRDRYFKGKQEEDFARGSKYFKGEQGETVARHKSRVNPQMRADVVRWEPKEG